MATKHPVLAERRFSLSPDFRCLLDCDTQGCPNARRIGY